MEGKLYKAIVLIFGLFFSFILVCMLVFDTRYFYMYTTNRTIPNFVFLIILLCMLIVYLSKHKVVKKKFATNYKTERLSGTEIRKNIIIMSFFLLAFQLFVAWNIFFKTGWDCSKIVSAAQNLYFNGETIGNNHYFSMYPNNVFLVSIFSGILKLSNLFGGAHDYFPLVVVGIVLVNLSGFFMVDVIRETTQNESLSYGMWFVFAFLTGLSPWVSIPYSDTYSIIFPILIVWFFVTKSRRPIIVNWALIVSFSLIGYFIKPTVLLTFISIAIVAAISSLSISRGERSTINVRKLIKYLTGIAIGLAVALSLRSLSTKVVGASLDKNQSFTAFHYLMMGMNVESGGGYNQWDTNYSAGAQTVSERNRQDLKLACERISDMGVKRFASFMVQKGLTNFNDGTFAWGNEGEFYWYIQERDNIFATLFREYYYEEGKAYMVFVTLTQFVWFAILATFVFSFMYLRGACDYKAVTIYLSVFAVSLFLMIFEARGRYLYLYSPLFYAAAALNLNRFTLWTKFHKKA